LSQRPLPDSTRHSQQKNIHAPGGIRTNDLSRRAAVDLRLRPRGHWDRQPTPISCQKDRVCKQKFKFLLFQVGGSRFESGLHSMAPMNEVCSISSDLVGNFWIMPRNRQLTPQAIFNYDSTDVNIKQEVWRNDRKSSFMRIHQRCHF
jgi:hypothetical protein